MSRLNSEELGGLLVVIGRLIRDSGQLLSAVLDGTSQPQIRAGLDEELGHYSGRELDELSRVDAGQILSALVDDNQFDVSLHHMTTLEVASAAAILQPDRGDRLVYLAAHLAGIPWPEVITSDNTLQPQWRSMRDVLSLVLQQECMEAGCEAAANAVLRRLGGPAYMLQALDARG